MKKCKLCGRHKVEDEYAYSRRAADGLKCVCNECVRKQRTKPTTTGQVALSRPGPMSAPTYAPEASAHRNDGNKHIKSRGIGC